MRRPLFLYLCSNAPFYAILLLAICVCIILFIKIFDTILGLNFEFSYLLKYGFEPILLTTIILTTIVSIVVYISFLYDLNKRKDIDDKTREIWKKKFIHTTILANSYYYDFKYSKQDKDFFLEQFIKKSRDRILSN